MKYLHFSSSLLVLLLSIPVSGLYANEKHDEHKHSVSVDTSEAESHEHEQHGTHEHGVATLSIAVGGEGVEIMLASPAANLVGFEHAASSVEDKQKLADAKTKLEAGTNLFHMNKAAGCKLKNAEVVSALLDNGEAHADDEKHAKHEHEEGEKHSKHAHDEDRDKEGKTHNDMDVSWLFACAKPDKIEEVSVKLFSVFPGGFHKIKAEWVTTTGASAQELNKDSTLRLK